jgi:hypothetical protein
VNDPVRVGGLSLGDRDDIVHFNIYHISSAFAEFRSEQLTLECGSNSQFPPPTNPSGAASCLLPAPVGPPIDIGGRSPVAVALALVAPEPRCIEMTISSTIRLTFDDRVREKRPGISSLSESTGSSSSPPFSSTTRPVLSARGNDRFCDVAPWNSNNLNLPSGGTNDKMLSRSHLLYLRVSFRPHVPRTNSYRIQGWNEQSDMTFGL